MTFVRKVRVGKYTYLREVESVWENGKPKQKYVRTVGKIIDNKKILSGYVENTEVTKVTICGSLMVLDAIAREIGLHELLGDYSHETLSLVYSHCIDPSSLNKMEDWFAKTELNQILNLDKLTQRRLSDTLDNINHEDRIDYYEQKIFSEMKKKYALDLDSFFYDVTNIYFFGSQCKIAKKGKSKEGGFKRIVQVGLATIGEGIPVFHKTFAGNVFDSRTLFDILTPLKEYGIKKSFLVFDRGVASKVNIADTKKLGFEVICGLSLDKKIKEEVRESIKNKDFVNVKNRVQLKSCAFYVSRKKYRHGNINGYKYICLNLKQRTDLKEKRLKGVHDAQEQVKDGKKAEKYQKFLTKRGRIRENILDEAEEFDGISVIFCTKRLSNREVVYRYFEKDIVEKAFACLKGVVKLRPIRSWLVGKVKAHIFICFLSYLLLSVLAYKLKIKKVHFSAIEAMDQLESMYKIHMFDKKTKNKFTKIVTLTKKQEDILKAIDKKLMKPSD